MPPGPPQRRTRLDQYGDLLTLTELAELLGTSPRTMARLRRHSPAQLPPEFRRIDRRPRYAAEHVRMWLEAGPAVLSLPRRRTA